MASDPNDPGAKKGGEAANWEQQLYAPDRMQKWVRGEMTLQELHGVTGPEMLEMAVIGYQMFEQGKHKEARTIFEGLATLDPKESYYRTALGAVYLAEDDLENAEVALNGALKLNPKDISAYVNRGEVFLRTGRAVEAASDFKKAVELDPKADDPLSARARALAEATLELLDSAGESGSLKKK